MPLTLYRYIFTETLRLLFISLFVLVGTLAFGFTIPAITDGLLTPLQLGKLIMYTMPLMLPYATPVAICFSTTLVFFRMASDNEITACIASGMSYRQLLTPVFIIGFVMMIIMAIISNWMIPHFSLRVTELIKQDLVTFVIRQVNKKQAVKMDQWTIYADAATDDVELPEVPEGQPRPYRRIVMYGVAVGQVDPETRLMTSEYTSEVAKIDLYQYEGETLANVLLEGITAVSPESNQLFESAYTNLQGLKLPSPFKMKIQYYSLPKLRKLDKNPDPFPDIREMRNELADIIAMHRAKQTIRAKLTSKGSAPIELISDNDHTVQIHARGYRNIKGNILLKAKAGKDIKLEINREGQLLESYMANEIELRPVQGAFGTEPSFEITMNQVKIFNPTTMTFINERDRLTLLSARLPEPVLAPLQGMTSKELEVVSKKEKLKPAIALSGKIDNQHQYIHKLINHQIHSRFAMAALGMLACLVSAIVAILLRHSVPLAIFFWCFMPTIATIFAIDGSKNVINGLNLSNEVARVLIWTAPAIMLLTAILCYMKARRH